MIVKELIEALRECPDDVKVYFPDYEWGDMILVTSATAEKLYDKKNGCIGINHSNREYKSHFCGVVLESE